MDVSRRNFNFGLLGVLAAPLLSGRSKAVEATSPPTKEEERFSTTCNYIAVGTVASQPQLKDYIRKDGSQGSRTFFRMDVADKRGKVVQKDVPIVLWGKVAEGAYQNLTVGHKVQLAGNAMTTDGWAHIVASAWRHA